MEELKNTDKKGIITKRKIGKTTYEVVARFNENARETMQDKLTRIMLREFRRESNERKKMILIKKSLTSSNRGNCAVQDIKTAAADVCTSRQQTCMFQIHLHSGDKCVQKMRQKLVTVLIKGIASLGQSPVVKQRPFVHGI